MVVSRPILEIVHSQNTTSLKSTAFTSKFLKISGFTFRFNTAQEVVALGIALPAVCILVVSLRFFTRSLQKLRIGIDDWLILAGLVCIIGLGLNDEGALGYAFGYPTPKAPAGLNPSQQSSYIGPETELALKITFAFQPISVLALGFVKLSIIAFYRRLFVINHTMFFDILTKTVSGFVFLWTVVFIFLNIFQCGRRVTASWGANLELLELLEDILIRLVSPLRMDSSPQI
ncbi:MAG: hypothetical protein MMC33_006882 [Icmadophila ericetorum]|nr:hypothetical protein [Icmadophila ericetorum]